MIFKLAKAALCYCFLMVNGVNTALAVEPQQDDGVTFDFSKPGAMDAMKVWLLTNQLGFGPKKQKNNDERLTQKTEQLKDISRNLDECGKKARQLIGADKASRTKAKKAFRECAASATSSVASVVSDMGL